MRPVRRLAGLLGRPFRRRRGAGGRRGERGSATVFVIGFAVVLFLAAGLAIDGGMAINKRMSVADDAEQAARVGADSINIEALRAGQGLVVDPTLARRNVNQYLAGLGYGGGATWHVQVAPEQVSVQIASRSKTYFLDFFGISFPVRASAVASPQTGPGGTP